MTWAKLDDQFFAHPKVIDLSKDAKLLFLAGLTYCASQLTDGQISQGALRMVAAQVDVPREAAAELVSAGMWVESTNGFQVHDYLDYNPSAEEVLSERAKAAARQATFRARHNGRHSDRTHNMSNGVSNVVSTGVSSASPYPYPITTSPYNTSTTAKGGVGGNDAEVSVADADASSDAAVPERPGADLTPDVTTDVTTDLASEPPAAASSATSRGKKSKQPQPAFTPESEPMRLATLLRDRIRDHAPTAKVPGDTRGLQPWASVVDLILRLDHRPPDEVEAVIHFATTDAFWRANVLSPGKLREKYDPLNIKRLQRQEQRQEQQHSLGSSGDTTGNAGNGGNSHGTPARHNANGYGGRSSRSGVATSADWIELVLSEPDKWSASDVARARARRDQRDAQPGVGAAPSAR